MIKRIKLEYLTKVRIPKKFGQFFWDYDEKTTILEKFIYRLLIYGDYKIIKWVYKRYPKQTYKIAMKYPEIKRGVKTWIKWWYERN